MRDHWLQSIEWFTTTILIKSKTRRIFYYMFKKPLVTELVIHNNYYIKSNMILYSVFTYTHYKPFFITVSKDLALKYW